MSKIEEWEKKLTEQENSGLTQATWCKNKALSMSKFRYWKRKLDNSDAPGVNFQKLQTKESKETVQETPGTVFIEFADIKITVSADVSIDLLKTVLRAAKSC